MIGYADAASLQASPKPADPGIPRMTPAVLRKSCLENRGYELPELNEVLILHYKGFRKIEGLDDYTNVRSIFLECNGISKIENLEVMPQLVSLYLQSNCIMRIENLDSLTNLQYLNLSKNSISEVENLAALSKLETLNLASNKLEDVEKLKGLTERPSLKSVDVSSNYFEDGDALLSFWPEHLPNVLCLYIHHNPCSRGLKDARRRLVSTLPKLRWIDERPVTAMERAGCEAWAIGGKDAEMEAKHAHWLKEKEEKDRSFQNYRRIQQEYVERANALKEANMCQDEATAGVKAAQVTEATEVSEATEATESSEETTPEGFILIPDTFGRGDKAKKVDNACTPVDDLSSPPAESHTPEDSASPAVCEETANSGSDSLEELEVGEEQEESVKIPTVFEWTGFKDRYNFKKASAALGKEFDCDVSEQECRRRYGELCRPSQITGNRQEAARQSMKEGSGRAADGPPPDAAAVKEVSQWFVRRIRQGNGQAVQKKQTPKWAANRQDPDEHEIDPEQEHLAPAPDRHLWERRPLPQDMVEYALEDDEDVKPMLQLQRLLLQELVEALGEQDAWQLVKEGSMAYAADFASQRECRCRLCCNAAENARFDGFRFMQRLQACQKEANLTGCRTGR
ncbi:unnamed protein product [Durusdinium trenchii]|uniref:Dynein assembly factor 1, axonemal homolog n=1 Tax=Durusdinium trenchii TaxID=1381693 RepID=A0ABP0RU48_9DINO